MCAKVVGEVAIDVTADIGPLVRQMKRGEGAMDGLRGAAGKAARGLQAFGDRAERLGKTLSVVTGAMAAIGGGAFLLAKGSAQSAKEIENLSRLANASTDEFQRMAAGARTVGIEQDKLSDILKDVNDRVGDFNATGGGPMADFFEQIAPKVGITAEAFKDLSGPQALQLYVDSLQRAGLDQQQMTFYMEAMASDATALIPLLANNGTEMRRLGDAAAKAGGVIGGTAIVAAGEFNTALTDLQTAFQGIKDKFATTLMPVFTDIMNGITEHVLPYLGKGVDKLGEWIAAFNELDPAVQGAVGAITAAFAAGGPVLVAIGATLKGLGLIVGFLTPVGGIAAALTAGIVIWAKWGGEITAILDGLVGKLDDFKTKALEAVGLGDRLDNISGGAQFGNIAGGGGGIGGMIGGLAGGIAGALRGPDAEQGTVIGQAIGQGLISGLGQSITDNEQAIRDYVNRVPEIAREELGVQSPSRVFAEIGQFLGMGMAQGISDSTGLVAAAAANMGNAAIENTETAAQGILGAMGTLFAGNAKIGAGIALVNGLIGASEELKKGVFGFKSAALVLAKAGAFASAIKSARPGSSLSGAGGAATAAPQVTETRTANINFYGGFQPTQETISMIATGLNDWLGDGGQLRIAR